MTSLATLTHAATAPAFNHDFYTTAATVIPALFIALAVLGPVYRKVLHGVWLIFLDVGKKIIPDSLPFPFNALDGALKVAATIVATLARLLLALILILVLAIGIATIAAGGYGELLAIYALYQAHDQPSTRLTVLLATMFLTILIAAGPLITYLINAFSP